MTTSVRLQDLCDTAAFCLGNSYAKEYTLVNATPCPHRELKKIQALQTLCMTILKLAKHKPKDRIDIPISIWNDLMLGKLQCLKATC